MLGIACANQTGKTFLDIDSSKEVEKMEAIRQSEKVVQDSRVLRWALENRGCRIVEVPHWVIMTLLEDVVHFGCHLIEQLVRTLDHTHSWVTEEGYLERTVEKFMNNVLLASLYEDGHIEDKNGFLDEVCLFDFHHELDIQIGLIPAGHEEQSWNEPNLFHGASGRMLT